MQGALLRSGKSDEFIALGETGQPVYKAALQIIAALARKSPDLALFLAIPKGNERGEVVDWYSPLPGDVIPWACATDDERESARNRLNDFIQSIGDMSRRLVENGEKTRQSDLQIFGKLLGLVSNCPDESCLYLIQRASRVEAGQQEIDLQPVLSFWGFVRNDADRHLDPLYFLTPRPVRPMTTGTPAPNDRSLSEASNTPSQAQTVSSTPASAPSAPPRPWWRRFWWLWPLLLLLTLLLLLSMLRGCGPGPGPGLPWGVSAPWDAALPATDPGASLPSGRPVDSSTGDPQATTGPATEQPSGEAPTSQPDADPAEPPVEQPAESAPAETPQAPEQSAPEEPAPESDSAAAPPELSIPPEAPEGPADFLNGNYRAGAGIIDATTAKPLRLEYAFEKGKGNVTIQRPDGTSCTGAVSAAMQGGQLGISSDDQAACTDGGRYDMPKVHCAPGAQNIADCTGAYGQTQFPMIMRRQ